MVNLIFPDGSSLNLEAVERGIYYKCTAANLPPAPEAGTLAWVTDAADGANFQYYDGSGWQVVGTGTSGGTVYTKNTGDDSTSTYFKTDPSNGNLVIHIPTNEAIEYRVGTDT